MSEEQIVDQFKKMLCSSPQTPSDGTVKMRSVRCPFCDGGINQLTGETCDKCEGTCLPPHVMRAIRKARKRQQGLERRNQPPVPAKPTEGDRRLGAEAEKLVVVAG